MLLNLVAYGNLDLEQHNVKTACLNMDLKKEFRERVIACGNHYMD